MEDKTKMNFVRKMRKLQHNAKALSPVVASIILIAVTVAVSIAVAMWMGNLSTGFMQTETIQLKNAAFVTGASGTVTVVIRNTATSAVTISSIYLNGVSIANANVTSPSAGAPFVIQPNGETTLTFQAAITAGNNYEIKVVTAKSNPFSISAVPPS